MAQAGTPQITKRTGQDYPVGFAWHYLEAIVKREREAGLKSKLVTALPEFKIWDSL